MGMNEAFTVSTGHQSLGGFPSVTQTTLMLCSRGQCGTPGSDCIIPKPRSTGLCDLFHEVLICLLLILVCLLTCFSPVRLFVTLWTVACKAPLAMGFSRQEYWSGLPCPPPGELPNPGTEPKSLYIACTGGRVLYH